MGWFSGGRVCFAAYFGMLGMSLLRTSGVLGYSFYNMGVDGAVAAITDRAIEVDATSLEDFTYRM